MSHALPSFTIDPDSVTLEDVLRVYQQKQKETKRFILSQEKKIFFTLLWISSLLITAELFACVFFNVFFPVPDPMKNELVQEQFFYQEERIFKGNKITFGFLGDFQEKTSGATLKHWKKLVPVLSQSRPQVLLIGLGWEDIVQISKQKDFSQIPSHSLLYHSAFVRLLLSLKKRWIESSPEGRKKQWIRFQERLPVSLHQSLIFQSITEDLKELVAFCNENQMDVVFCELPHFFQSLPDPETPESLKLSSLSGISIWSLKNWQEMLEQFNKNLRHVAVQEEIFVISFPSPFFSSNQFRDFRQLTKEGKQHLFQEIFRQLNTSPFFSPLKKE